MIIFLHQSSPLHFVKICKGSDCNFNNSLLKNEAGNRNSKYNYSFLVQGRLGEAELQRLGVGRHIARGEQRKRMGSLKLISLYEQHPGSLSETEKNPS